METTVELAFASGLSLAAAADMPDEPAHDDLTTPVFELPSTAIDATSDGALVTFG